MKAYSLPPPPIWNWCLYCWIISDSIPVSPGSIKKKITATATNKTLCQQENNKKIFLPSLVFKMSCFHFFKVGDLTPYICLPNGLRRRKCGEMITSGPEWREMLDEHICFSHSDTLSSDDDSQALDPYIFHVCEGVQLSLQRRPILNIMALHVQPSTE